MKITKFFPVAAAAMLLSFGSAASATTLTFSTTDVFGSGSGQIDPGGTDVLNDGSVIVSDQSTGRFNHTMSLGGVTDITQIDLVLTFDMSGPSCPFGICGLGETWDIRANGSDNSGTSDDTFLGLADVLSPQTFSFSAATDTGSIDTFATWIANDEVSFWFSEGSFHPDSFALNSAQLNVYSDVAPVPLPSGAFLLLVGLVGLGALRRRKMYT